MNQAGRLAALALVAMLAACSSAPTTVYSLRPVPPPQGDATAGPPMTPPIELGEVMIPGAIDRDAVVIAAPGGVLDVSNTAIWGAPLSEMIRLTLSADLQARLPSGFVLAPGDPAPPGGLRILLVNVQMFSASTHGQVDLVADWSITSGNGVATGAPTNAVLRVDTGSSDLSAIAPAMSRALGLMADQIAAKLK